MRLKIQCRDQPGGVGNARRVASAVAKETTGVSGNSSFRLTADELEREVLHRDDEVETLSFVFQLQEVPEAGPVLRIRESPPVDVLGIVVEAAVSQTVIEDPRELALTHDRNLGIPPGRVQDKDRLLAACGPGRRAPELAEDDQCRHQPAPDRMQPSKDSHAKSQNLISVVVLRNRGVRIVNGCNHVPPGTRPLRESRR